jgi:hypothetical protein
MQQSIDDNSIQYFVVVVASSIKDIKKSTVPTIFFNRYLFYYCSVPAVLSYLLTYLLTTSTVQHRMSDMDNNLLNVSRKKVVCHMLQ